ncbi:MAG: N-alpha-acetyltransferase 35 NatC auxiliary subunit [Caeruleum heppii]|nr:MAG: N-alpha-acetyltransferase 35 NatC auxiliary subunit [Caeruleum heppii]
MDPKMDSGFLTPGDTLDDDYDVLRQLAPEEVVGIIDQLICHEMAWHMGSPLSQTIFTSLYIDDLLSHEPTTLGDANFHRARRRALGEYRNSVTELELSECLLHLVLRSYCLGLIKCCDFVNARIGGEHFYEEEDFVTHTCNRSLLGSVSASEVELLLDTALEWLDEQRPSNTVALSALQTRLKLRRALLSALVEDVDVLRPANLTRWKICADLLPELEKSKAQGRPVKDSFSAKLQRKLASTVPPRPVVDVSFVDAVAHLRRLCRDAQEVLSVLDYQGSNNMMTFVWIFQSRDPQPTMYVRALLQFMLFGDIKVLGQLFIKQLLYDDLAETVLPGDVLIDPDNDEVELPADPRAEIATTMNVFVARAGRASKTDLELRQFVPDDPLLEISVSPEPVFRYPLSSWACHHKLRQAEWVLQLGFELDIYQADELAGMYWYLKYLTEAHLGHLSWIQTFVTHRHTHAIGLPTKSRQAFEKALSFIEICILELRATHDFAEALSCFHTVLLRLGLVPTTQRPYSTDALRHELRMKPFITLGAPEALLFDDFRKFSTFSEENNLTLLAHATSCISSARKDLDTLYNRSPPETTRSVLCAEEWRANGRNVLRACILAGIVVAKVQQVVQDGGKGEDRRVELKVDVGASQTRYHRWWIVPTLR